MITFIAQVRVRPENAAAYEALMTHVRDTTRAREADVLFYDFGKSADDSGKSADAPEVYAVLEVYRDAAAHAAHMAAPWVTESIAETRRLIEGGFDIRQYVSPGTAPAARRMQESAMDTQKNLTGLEYLMELQAIYDLKGRRDHAVDRKDWDTYAQLHTDDYVAMSITATPIVGGKAAAKQLAVQMANVTTVHHCHTPVIEFQDRDNATGVWAMEDNLFWTRNGEKQWLRGFGFYHETYVKGADGKWRFSYRRLERTHAQTSAGAAILAADHSGENAMVGAG